MKKKIIIVIAIVVLLIAVSAILFFVLGNSSNRGTGTTTTGTLPTTTTSTALTPTPIPTSTIITLGTSQGNVTTTNFYANADYITQDQQTVAIKNSPDYTIIYNVADSSFVISILSTPLETTREAAEQAFLTSLGISQQIACKLNVYEGVPISVSDEYPGQSFPLSFCGSPTSL